MNYFKFFHLFSEQGTQRSEGFEDSRIQGVEWKRQRVGGSAKHLHLYTSKHLISSLFRAGNCGNSCAEGTVVCPSQSLSSLFRAGNNLFLRVYEPPLCIYDILLI